jgi:hypothetical protein
MGHEELQSLPNVEGKKRLEVLHYLIHHLGAASKSLASTNEQLKLRELIDIAMTFLEPSNPVGFVRGRSSAASGPELGTETTKVGMYVRYPAPRSVSELPLCAYVDEEEDSILHGESIERTPGPVRGLPGE